LDDTFPETKSIEGHKEFDYHKNQAATIDYILDTKDSNDDLKRINSNQSINDHKKVDGNKNKKSHFKLPSISNSKNKMNVASYEM